MLEVVYVSPSTRSIAGKAVVPLSQIHYHFGSKETLILALIERESEKLLDRQKPLYNSEQPPWKQWEQACDFLDGDMAPVAHDSAS